MYDLLLGMMEDKKETISFYSRMETFYDFLLKHKIIDDLYEPQSDTPMSIIWAVSSLQPEVFAYQLGAIAQFPNILHEQDQLIFVVDKRRTEVLPIIEGLDQYIDVKIVVVDRQTDGDRPTFNWDIGLDYVTHDRTLFVRDMALFFQPWDFIRIAREVPLDKTLTNYSTILGSPWAKFSEQWVYLVHPLYAPTPYLFAFVASSNEVKNMSGFDQTFRRGYDHSGELDFLLRWNIAGNSVEFTSDTLLLHPGMHASPEDVELMTQSSLIIRRPFMDRYGEEFINKCEPPFTLETQLVEVNQALTMHPLSVLPRVEKVEWDKPAPTFIKRPNDVWITEEI